MKYDILFFPWRDWNSMKVEGFRTREANILQKLVKDERVGRVLCINRSKIPTYIKRVIQLKNKSNFEVSSINSMQEEVIYQRLFSKLLKVSDKLFILDLNYHIPNPKGNKLERFDFFGNILQKEVKASLNSLNFNKYLTWNFDLTRISTSDKLKNDLLIFDSIDNLLEHDQSGNDIAFYKSRYEIVRKKADLIFTVSEENKKVLYGSNSNVTYIPNGIDLNSYLDTKNEMPENLTKDKPNIGYIGLMQERIDVALLKDVIINLPNYQFNFIGPVLSPNYFKELKLMPNVKFIGAVRHDQIPTYLKYMDVCLIPHKLNKFTMSMNPLKLYEYLAASKEVVMTPVPPAETFSDVVHIAQNSDQFISAIEKAITNPFSSFSKQDISEKIKEHDWSSRINHMFKQIETSLLEKNH